MKETILDKKLQEIASSNWEQFVHLIGGEAIIKAKICLLRQNNHSYGEIKNRLGITEDRVRYGCAKCDTNKQSQ
ncbi:hypothetical protein [Chitinophaga sancti]|uniref:Sigma-70, region 4 n=1 Tax=Chitinophaga sancti TaxID=1004 RepID=A0A1K1LYJ4_9BACT|nr:hypothetical protein [Chitinophaga sancti]WQD64748.1 hypothetical protein U0033_10105 [Chitinophaga sancti]WQG89630.1 hypothetical protein SR876_32370 [Chitinophaga sancti]SFW15939.1 hypothetical protein SAMN05661012_00323 [Chitinophaga sancti]